MISKEDVTLKFYDNRINTIFLEINILKCLVFPLYFPRSFYFALIYIFVCCASLKEILRREKQYERLNKKKKRCQKKKKNV